MKFTLFLLAVATAIKIRDDVQEEGLEDQLKEAYEDCLQGADQETCGQLAWDLCVDEVGEDNCAALWAELDGGDEDENDEDEDDDDEDDDDEDDEDEDDDDEDDEDEDDDDDDEDDEDGELVDQLVEAWEECLGEADEDTC